MNIVALVKLVPDTYSEKQIRPEDLRIDRQGGDAVIDEIDTRAVEAALRLVEEYGGEVTVLTMGPDRSVEALRKGLAMGAAKAIHVVDDGLIGSDALQTSAVLADAVRSASPDLVIAGNVSSDGGMSVVPAMVAERLTWPQLTSVIDLAVQDGQVSVQRIADGAVMTLRASLPAVVSINEKANEPRYPNFKGIMAAKKKPLQVVGSNDLQTQTSTACEVVKAVARPAREAGRKVLDEGDGGHQVADYLESQKLL